MAETLKTFGEGIERVMNRSKSIDQHLTHASSSVLDMLKSLAGIHLIQKSIETLMDNSNLGKSISMAFRTAKTDMTELLDQQDRARDNFHEWRSMVGERIRTGKIKHLQARRESAELKAQLTTYTAQLEFKREIQKISKGEIALAGTFLAALTSTYNVFAKTSQTLIDSNASLSERLQLTRSILNVQRQLGSETTQSVEAARDLVEYGFDLDKSFESTLKLVIQMKDGLGLSTRLGAELAAIYERQLRTPARDVADAMTRVVADTALAADEAGRMATNIGRAVALLKPGMNADLGAVTELVGRYEGALKSLGGQVGGFEELLTRMTTSQGLLPAGVLGVRGPEFIRSEEATQQVIDSFADYARNFLGDTSGWERMLRLENLSEIFGVSSQQISFMIRAVEDQNNQRKSSIDIEQRYRDQVFATAEVLSRLKNSLVSVAQQAVLPLIDYTTALLRPVADYLEQLKKWPGLVYVAGVTLAAGAVIAARQLYKVTTALYTMAVAAHIAAKRVREQAISNALASAGGAGGALATGGGASMLARTSALIGRVLGVAAAPLIAAAVGYAVYQGMRHYFELDKKYVTASLNRSSKEFYGGLFVQRVVSNDIEGLKEAIILARGRYLQEGLSLDKANELIYQQVNGLAEIAEAMRFTKEVTKSLFGPNVEEAKEIAKLTETQKSLVDIAATHRDNAVQTKQIQERHLKRVEELNEKQEQEGLMMRTLRQVGDWEKTAFDYYFKR